MGYMMIFYYTKWCYFDNGSYFTTVLPKAFLCVQCWHGNSKLVLADI